MTMGMLVLTASINQAQANYSIGELVLSGDGKGYFNCSYKGKKASKKCLVTTFEVKASIDSRTKQVYRSEYTMQQMNIKWPDGDTSRYAIIHGNQIFNLADKTDYEIRGLDPDSSDWYPKGFFIYSRGKEHVGLW